MSAAPVVEVSGLVKRYGGVPAVDEVTFTVAAGEVYGLLGENGAGKTTAVEILEGFRTRTSGSVSVLGRDPGDRDRSLRDRIGIVLQSSGIERVLTVGEVLRCTAPAIDDRGRSRRVSPWSASRAPSASAVTASLVASAAASISPLASSAIRTCCSSTSRPRGSIRLPGVGRGS